MMNANPARVQILPEARTLLERAEAALLEIGLDPAQFCALLEAREIDTTEAEFSLDGEHACTVNEALEGHAEIDHTPDLALVATYLTIKE